MSEVFGNLLGNDFMHLFATYVDSYSYIFDLHVHIYVSTHTLYECVLLYAGRVGHVRSLREPSQKHPRLGDARRRSAQAGIRTRQDGVQGRPVECRALKLLRMGRVPSTYIIRVHIMCVCIYIYVCVCIYVYIRDSS